MAVKQTKYTIFIGFQLGERRWGGFYMNHFYSHLEYLVKKPICMNVNQTKYDIFIGFQ